MNRRFLQFGLRTLLIVVTVCALAGGWLAERMHRRQAALRTIAAAGGSHSTEFNRRQLDVALSYSLRKPLPPAERTWRERLLGDLQRDVQFTAGPPLSAETFDAVAAIGEVKMLGFHEARLNDDGLARLGGLRHIETLVAHGCAITDRSAPVLASFQKLRWLELSDTQITDAGVPHLVKLQKLAVLRIQGTKITDRGFAQLAALKNLRDLTIGDSPNNPMPVSVKCRDEVQRALPNCRFNGTFRGI
jgi:hypothetical protein